MCGSATPSGIHGKWVAKRPILGWTSGLKVPPYSPPPGRCRPTPGYCDVERDGEVRYVPDQAHVSQAATYLRMLLLRPGEYRSRWEQQRDGTGDGDRYQAVARVIEGTGDRRLVGPSGTEMAEVARRALQGAEFDPAVADAFVTGFGLTVRQAQRLRDLLRGSQTVRVVSGPTLPPPTRYQAGRLRHETLSLHERHVLGPDGQPAEHETIQVIKATEDGLNAVPYRFDTDELLVEVIRGGRVGERAYRVNDSIFGVDIVLHWPLKAGETILMQYRATFFYKSAPAPEFRRAVLRSTRDLTMWVKFDPERVPARVFRASWDRLDLARVIERVQVEPDDQLSVHHRFGRVDKAVVGFYWEWD
jgi:hypothetical protein